MVLLIWLAFISLLFLLFRRFKYQHKAKAIDSQSNQVYGYLNIKPPFYRTPSTYSQSI